MVLKAAYTSPAAHELEISYTKVNPDVAVIWNLGTPKFMYEFMKHMNSYMKKTYEFIVCVNSYMNSKYEFIYI